MAREPLLIPVICLATGILVAHHIPVSLPLVVAGILLALLFWWAFRARTRYGIYGICASLALAGMGLEQMHKRGPAPQLTADDAETVVLSGCVINPPVFSPGREQFTLKLAPKASARITVALKDREQLSLEYGELIEVAAKVRMPRNYQNPNGFDFVGYLASQNIYWTGSVRSMAEIERKPGRCGSSFVAGLYHIRTWALRRLTELYPGDARSAALLSAILLGETGAVERRWTSDFRLTGTYHALVISGQHVSVLALTLLFILKAVQVRRVPALCIATVASWMYAFISGMSSPVVRAAGGFTLFLVASYFFRQVRILNVLAVVALVYLTYDPDQLFDPSFQLSFLSAAAIAVFAIPLMERTTEPIAAAVKRFDQVGYDPKVEMRAAQWRVEFRLFAETVQVWTRLPKRWAQRLVAGSVRLAVFIADAMLVSACVQFGLALPMVMYFHRLAITGLSANVVVVPLLSLVIPFGFGAIITGSHLLAWCTRWFLHLAELVAAWHVRFEPSWRIADLPSSLVLAFGILLITLSFAIRLGKKYFTVANAVAAFILFTLVCYQPWPALLSKGELEVTAIDVNQGDSLLVVFPNGQTMLVDAGGFPGMSRMARKPQIDVGEDVVSPYLWSRRIRHLDYAVLTHGHSDHMDGLPAILDNFHPQYLWVGAEPETDAWAGVRKHAAEDRVQVVSWKRCEKALNVGGAQIRILAPAPDYEPGEDAHNNDSLVFEIAYKGKNVLFTGDAERPVEDDLVSAGLLHSVTLLKVGHHGSKTSSSEEFLSELNPQFALISDGYKNQFHHPHPDVLQRLQDHHTTIYRTDQRGLVTFRTDGQSVHWETFR